MGAGIGGPFDALVYRGRGLAIVEWLDMKTSEVRQAGAEVLDIADYRTYMPASLT